MRYSERMQSAGAGTVQSRLVLGAREKRPLAASTLAAVMWASLVAGLLSSSVHAQNTAAMPVEAGSIPAMKSAVPPSGLLGNGLTPDHYDETGYPESAEGLLVIELDPNAGPITLLRGKEPHYLEAQFLNTQRDAIWMARKRSLFDVLPSGASHEIPYGYGAIKRSFSAITLVEAQLVPHISDNQKSYETFPLRDLYIGAALSLTGLLGEVRWTEKERYVAFGQAGLNVLALADAKINRTYGAFAVPLTLGGGIRYPALIGILGTHWLTGAELSLGLGAADDDKETGNVIVLPGLFHELEWTFDRNLGVTDYRADPRPYNYGAHALYVKLTAYADIFGAASSGILFNILVGYRLNIIGPSIPAHDFKQTQATYASQRYVQRKQEEEQRRKQLEDLRRQRGTNSSSYPSP
jgi:hypothetical protein